MSCEATRSKSAVIPEHAVGSIASDAMGQSKLRIPRGELVVRAKEVQGLWKPALHVVGCSFDGVSDFLYVVDANIVKDSNCVVICLSRTIVAASHILEARSKQMPLQLQVRSENGDSEAKN